MRNNKDYIAVSIESRKGGVGKTTAALNLGLYCLEESGFSNNPNNYEVIYLDLDISGTEAAKAFTSLESSYWGRGLNIVKCADAKDKSKYVNLVDMFEDYMAGNLSKYLDFKWINDKDSVKDDKLILKKGKVNVFSSFLKSFSGSDKKHTYGPNILYDEMHSQWFIEMLKTIIQKCISRYTGDEYNSENNLRFCVIIDNSPGNTSISHAIEEWLTDVGPQFGKFLFISSMDKQDIIACLDGIKGVHERFKNKWNASREYIKAIKAENSYFCLNPMEKMFFQRLVDDSQEIKSECYGCGSSLCFCEKYPDYALSFFASQKTEDGEKYIDDASRFCSLIINKDLTAELTRINPEFIYNCKFIFEELGIAIDDRKIVPYADIPLVLDEIKDGKIAGTKKISSEFEIILRRLPGDLTIKYSRILSLQYLADIVEESPYEMNRIVSKPLNYSEIEKAKKTMKTLSDGFIGKNTDTTEEYKGFIGSVYDSIEYYNKELRNIFKDENYHRSKTDILFVDDYFIGWLNNFRKSLYRACQLIFPRGGINEDINSVLIRKEKVVLSSIDFGRYIIRNINEGNIDIENAATHAVRISRRINKERAKMMSAFVSPYLCFSFALAGVPSFTNPLLKALTVFEIIFFCSLREDRFVFNNELNGMSWKTLASDENVLDEIISHVLSDEVFNEYTDGIHITRGHFHELHKNLHEEWARVIDIREDFNFIIDCIVIINERFLLSHREVIAIRDIAMSVVVHKTRSHSKGYELLSLYLRKEGRDANANSQNDLPKRIMVEKIEVEGFLKAYRTIFGIDEWSTL